MGLLNNYPVTINSHELPSPSSWQISVGIVENVMQTEAGTDVVDLTRAGKITINAQFKLAEGTSDTDEIGQEVKTLQGFATAGALTVKYYDPGTAAYAEKTMRMRNFTAQLVPRSDRLTAVNGVWNVSFALIEY